MDKSKKSIEKEKKAKEKARSFYLDQISENEKETNRMIVIVSFAFIVLLGLMRIGIRIDYSFTLDIFTYYYILPICIFMVLIDGIAIFNKFSKPWIKYMLMSGIILICTISFMAFTTYVFYLVFLPIILVIKYFNEKLTKRVTIITGALFVISCFVNYYFSDKSEAIQLLHLATSYDSWNRLIDVVIYIFTPATVLIIFYGIYGINVTKSGKNLLKHYADNETKIALVNAELDMAAEIQKSVLPDEKFTTPDSNFSILAKEIPAKEVGGDFYDYFMLDEYTLAVLVADVSDKGVPAAMFMMSAKKAIRCAAECCHTLSETVELSNKLICQDNKSDMFLTLWLGLIDTRSGVGKYINAGHFMPMLKKEDGSVCLIENEPDLMIGNFPDMPPMVNRFQMSKGDTLILYTDGITDAMNEKGISLGIKNVMETVRLLPDDIETLTDGIISKDKEHMGGCEQFDDMTILALKCNELEEPSVTSLNIMADALGTKQFIDTVEETLLKGGCPDNIRRNIETSVDEICTNIVDYAYENGGTMGLEIVTGHNFINLIFTDSGVPFNPIEKDDPDIDGEPQIGGLGIYFAKTLMDYMQYEYSEGKNVLTTGVIWNM